MVVPDGVRSVPEHLCCCKNCTAAKSMIDEEEFRRHMRDKDAARKFLKRNGFAREDWHKWLDEIGWFCRSANSM
jgi:hypothetical protein